MKPGARVSKEGPNIQRGGSAESIDRLFGRMNSAARGQTCWTCAYRAIDLDCVPCAECDAHDRWEPKEAERG